MKLLLLLTLCLVSCQQEGNNEAHAREENWGIANKTLNKDDFDYLMISTVTGQAQVGGGQRPSRGRLGRVQGQ